jgi:hypothetical protein
VIALVGVGHLELLEITFRWGKVPEKGADTRQGKCWFTRISEPVALLALAVVGSVCTGESKSRRKKREKLNSN